MSLLAVLEALRARLEGKSFDYIAAVQGNTPATQAASLVRTSPEALVAYYQRTSRIERRGFNVAVQFKGHEGYENERVYPSLAFDCIGTPFRAEGYIPHHTAYGGTTFYGDVATSREDVYDEETGELIEANAARMVVASAPSTPVNYILEVRALARDTLSHSRLMEHVYRVMPPRHWLRVAQVDGTYRSWSLMLTDTEDLDKRQAVLEGATEREHTFVWTYTLEGWLDSSHDARYVNLVRKRVFTLNPTEE